jgi:hypothetical protein
MDHGAGLGIATLKNISSPSGSRTVVTDISDCSVRVRYEEEGFSFGVGISEGSSKHGNKLSGSIKFGEFPDQLSDCQLLKKDSAL